MLLLSGAPASAQSSKSDYQVLAQIGQAPKRALPIPNKPVSEDEIARAARINNWTVGVAGGLLEGTFSKYAADLGKALDDTDNLRVLPIVTYGAVGNVTDLLYLKGVDFAITYADVLDYFKNVEKIPGIERRVNYVIPMFQGEFHLFVRPEIKTIKDLAGKKIGNPAGDGARTIWPALAKANGIDPNSVTWVNIDANSKLAALKSKSIDATTSFYNIHHIFQKELGDDMGFVAWKDVGLNPYGNTIIVNGDYLKKNKPVVANFVKVTQKAFAACVKEPKPCVQAMLDANGALQFDNELQNWSLVEVLMSDKFSKTVALGVLDDARMAADYDLVKTYIGIDKPFDVKSAYTNEFLDNSVKMTK